MKNFYVISGIHKDPNKIETIVKSVEKRFGPFEEIEANNLAKSLIQKNIDDFYHRAWVVKSDNLTK
ncbi:hypothetical protein OAB25_03950 [Candidatus Pelagibacter sp.]|jgi:hypothetical protein|nr:hypothetical protein [Candidatus Pelagibacter sp.]MDA7783002.1 hypothetical protein [Candidatus Pelagibacter sp.]MDB2311409.1 hypothetical protein [Candidatus Pelagibacter bacterium]MDB9767823.1 hypothetical protein [Candidatus Pelagibacter sp.]|tara:strand:+ start:405 stop:602 length:198 start_codon:yes stop_codon:yes gene_type:complete